MRYSDLGVAVEDEKRKERAVWCGTGAEMGVDSRSGSAKETIVQTRLYLGGARDCQPVKSRKHRAEFKKDW